MSKKSFYSLISAAALSLGLTIPAGATVTATVSSTLPAGYATQNFGATLASSTNLGATYTSTGVAGTASTSVVNAYTDPFSGAGTFAYAEAGGSVTATLGSGITTLALLWGSPDTYNTISFNKDGSFTPGSGILSGLNPNQATSQYVIFSGLTGDTSITFSSSANSFEFDTLVPSAVTPSPEPASIALLAGGLLAIGAGAIRRRKSN